MVMKSQTTPEPETYEEDPDYFHLLQAKKELKEADDMLGALAESLGHDQHMAEQPGGQKAMVNHESDVAFYKQQKLDCQAIFDMIENKSKDKTVVNEDYSSVFDLDESEDFADYADEWDSVKLNDEFLKAESEALLKERFLNKVTNAGLSTKNQRIVIDKACLAYTSSGDPCYLVFAEHANDQKTEIRQCGSHLVNDITKKSNGAVNNVKYAEYSVDQYNKIMSAANCDGNKPVINADLQVNPKGQGHRIISNRVTKPTMAFDSAAHVAMLKEAYAVELQKEKNREEAFGRLSENDNCIDL